MRGRIQPRNLRQQVKIERKKRNVIFFATITFALIYISISLLFGDMGFIKYLKLKKIKSTLETEIITLEKENKMLQAQIKALKEDPYYIEKYAREEFGMARPDEYIFQFENDKN
ncbi:septum formation initiator family protein [Dissulfurispira thermophila]|uniref:Septum formation initiator family protein n=2 Tax=root TaxID=1 RepID=A0A7G1H1V3_9BACT|nr:septum formation initiator family protein [Dissulfurispira thermophila]BCB96618.1 septum formation initiator family protein [Dissulfurispira thermophila]